jgi:hypothetical protein
VAVEVVEPSYPVQDSSSGVELSSPTRTRALAERMGKPHPFPVRFQ